ncbi:MAG: AAA family ATPase [Gemmatimonadota bacterium]|nr:AAA family ATPase [Gemmatimonadota bacterium]
MTGHIPSGSGSSALDALRIGALPLVGRSGEMEELVSGLLAEDSRHGLMMVCGAGGVGKSRLVSAVVGEAERRRWSTVTGRAYPAESGMAYALFSDAFRSVVHTLDRATLMALTRGGLDELRFVFPGIEDSGRAQPREDWGDPGEFKTRLLWNFTEFLKGYSQRGPLLVVLEDLQWADASSLEFLHFAARHLDGSNVRFLCTYNDELSAGNGALVATASSLRALGVAGTLQLGPLHGDDTLALVSETFGIDPQAVREFAGRLHEWTGGSPLFIGETLKSVVEDGSLYERDGLWLGWEATDMRLPGSIREGILRRVRSLTPEARAVADHVAVVGGPTRHELLERLTEPAPGRFLEVLDELRAQHIVTESEADGRIHYDVTHHLLRETLYTELGKARARLVHASIAAALEDVHGAAALDHAEEIAYHVVRSGSGVSVDQATAYLIEAAGKALGRHADPEAEAFLQTALAMLDGGDEGERRRVIRLLAKAKQRRGRYGEALELLAGLVEDDALDGGRKAGIHRNMGLACYWSGRHAEAVAHFDAGLAVVGAVPPETANAIRLARGVCLQEMGRPDDAQEEIHRVLRSAEESGAEPLMARAHRALAMLHTWTGTPEEGRKHARAALELAQRCGDLQVVFWSHWAWAALEGLMGDTGRMMEEIRLAEDVADTLRSPVFRIWTAELSIQHAYATGEWDKAVILGERAIGRARSLNQRTLLPRLLVWTALIYFAQGELERGREMVEEAWTLSGLDGGEPGLDLHTAIPAHIGRAAYHLAMEEHEEAVRVGAAGVAMADASGFVVWSIHHLLPIVLESLIHSRDLEGAARTGVRLREDSERLGHRLGMAWAGAADALLVWLSGDVERGAVLLREAADALDAVPIVPDAIRVRRQLARRLIELGDREAALEELRRVHDTVAQLGMKRELEKTRALFRDLGSRPPPRGVVEGTGSLTGRETEIARLAAEGESNKGIARTLGVSTRTVTTHLANVYRKMGITSRHQLAAMVREGRL